MTIGEVKSIYSAQLSAYNIQKNKLAAKRNEQEEMIGKTEIGMVLNANEAAVLELTYNAVAEKQSEYQKYMNQITEQWDAKFNEVVAKENAKAEEEGFKELQKIMEVVRRMTHGDIVPHSDEKKVMDYDKDMYQMAKSAQMLAQMRKEERKEHESLWEDEEKRESRDATEVADNQEAFAPGPEVVSVEEVIASVSDGAVTTE